MTALLYLRPCANCAALIQGGNELFCSGLCKQTAKVVRYARKASADGRTLPDVREAINTRIAMIAGGGYDEKGRRISPADRAAVEARSGGRCERCGAPGEKIDHIEGSSSALNNLQSLCRRCHDEKTAQSFRPAPAEVVRLVHRPIQARIEADEPRQPSDIPEWHYRQWVSSVPGRDVTAPWLDWAWDRQATATLPSTPAEAAAGFPERMEPWAWYAPGA